MDIDGDSEGACSKGGFKFDNPFVPERGFYQPSSEASWESYQALLGVVEQQLGGFSTPVLCGVAHEVLSVLKCSNFMSLSDKKTEIEKQLGPVPDCLFDQLFEISDCISDYFRDDERLMIGGGGEIESDGRDILFVPEEGFYQPRTEETWTAYKLLLDVIQEQLGGGDDQPEVILCTVAHEVLQILKNEKIDRPEVRREMIDNLLNRVSDRNFDLLVFVSGIIYDFGDPLATRSSNSINKIDQWEQKAVTLSPPVQQSEINQMVLFPRDDDDDDDDDANEISEKLNEMTIDHDDLIYDTIEDSGGESTDEPEPEEEEEPEKEEEEDYHVCSDGAMEEDEEWVMVDAATF